MQQFTVSVLNNPFRLMVMMSLTMMMMMMMMMMVILTRLRLDEGELGEAHKAAGWRRMFAFWARS